MQQAARVHKRQGRAHLACDRTRAQRLTWRERIQVAAIEQLHGVKWSLLIHAVVVDLDDAGMRELRECVVFAGQELGGAPGVSFLAQRAQALHGDAALSHGVLDLEHQGHTAAAKLAPQLIAAERGVGRHGDRARNRVIFYAHTPSLTCISRRRRGYDLLSRSNLRRAAYTTR
jgi:hypothetical protein